MKITFVLPVLIQSGGARVVGVYAERLQALGHDVTVVSRQPQPLNWRRRIKNARRMYSWNKARNVTFFKALGDKHIHLPWKLPLDADDVPDADVVIATWWRTAFEVAALPPKKGAKAYFVQGHEIHKGQPRDLSGGSYYLPLRKITISDWLARTMAEVYGDTNIAKVPNSVDTNLFDAPPRSRNDRPCIGFMYSKTHVKGTDIILRALETARVHNPDLRIVAFGAHPPAPELPLPKGAEFHLLPSQDQIARIYASCDAWLFGSRQEGFGLPLLEAMACRTPVIGTGAGAAPELIRDGTSGYLVDIDDATAMSTRINDLLALSSADWQAMSDTAYDTAHGYTWDDATKAFETALKNIVAQ